MKYFRRAGVRGNLKGKLRFMDIADNKMAKPRFIIRLSVNAINVARRIRWAKIYPT